MASRRPEAGPDEGPQIVRSLSLSRRIIYSLLPLAVLYGIVETALTVLYRRGIVEPVSCWIYEETPSGWSYRFDPVIGFRISQEPSRLATTVSNGIIESVGTIKGNNLGFADRDDFDPRRTDPGRKRLAVFGDSFSAAQYNPRPWPDMAEDLTRDGSEPLELLNFSLDGGGLVNWWSVLTRLVEAEGYEIDGVVFAVFGDDLRRGFAVGDDSLVRNGRRWVLYRQIPVDLLPWLPRDVYEALPLMIALERWESVPTARFEALLRGEWHPRPDRSFKPYLARKTLDGMRRIFGRDGDDRGELPELHPEVAKLVGDMRRYLLEHDLPATVVYVPWRTGVLGGEDPAGSPAEARRFAELLGADYVDGKAAFDGISRRQIRDCWLEYDGHFTQTGADRFARFMADLLTNWPAGRTSAPARRARRKPGNDETSQPPRRCAKAAAATAGRRRPSA